MTDPSAKDDNATVGSQSTNQKSGPQLISREVICIACLSMASSCMLILLVWICVVRGDCLHHGPDSCASRKISVPQGQGQGPASGPLSEDPPPGFQGNADVYGLGIRLGIYCQWISSIIANALLDEHARRMTTVPYVGFQLAMIAALLYLVFRSDCTFTAEVCVILYILLGGVFIVLAPELVQSFQHVRWKAELRPKYRLFSTFVWILVAWVVPVSAWFWIRLADADDHPDFAPTPGGTSMFLIARVTQGQVRVASIFMAVWSIVLGLFAIEKVVLASLYKALEVELRPAFLMLLDVFYRILCVLFALFRTASSHFVTSYNNDPSRTPGEYIRDFLDAQINLSLADMSVKSEGRCSERATRLYAFGLASFNFTMSICAVELTLAWNHVSSISSLAATGQIIALFVGVSTLVSVCWDLSKTIHGHQAHLPTASQWESVAPYDLEASMWQTGDVIKS